MKTNVYAGINQNYRVHMDWITDTSTGDTYNIWYCTNPEGKKTPICATEKEAKKCADRGDWLY